MSDEIYYYSESDSEGSEMLDDSSAYFKNCSFAGLRKTINKQINKIFFGKGGEGSNEFMKKLVAQERRVAMLERQQSAQKSGESG